MYRFLLAAILCVSGAIETSRPGPALADKPKQKHSYSYVCNNDGCKDHGRVYTYKEDTPHEHKCPTCKNRLDQVKDD